MGRRYMYIYTDYVVIDYDHLILCFTLVINHADDHNNNFGPTWILILM
jgi:hypothetical protein